MAQAPIPQELIDQLLEGYEVPSDLTGPDGLIKQLVGRLIEAASAGELTDHLGYDKGDPAGRGSGNSRNGTTPKTLVTEMGELPVKIAQELRAEDPVQRYENQDQDGGEAATICEREARPQ